MAHARQTLPPLHPVIPPAGGAPLVPLDTSSGSAAPTIPVASVVGVVPFSFDFFNEGGRGNLLPGRPTTRDLTFANPTGAGCFLALTTINGAFVTDGRANLTARPLGEFEVSIGLASSTVVRCRVRLSDDNGDDPVIVQAAGVVVLFR
jgi:hypothetical protein